MTRNCKSKCHPEGTRCHCGTAAGANLKDEALRLLEARREAFIRRGRRALLLAMLTGDGRASADDVSAAVELPADIDPRCLGSVPGRLAYDKIIRAAGFVRSTRPECHARWVQVWALADRAAAVRWLADNPDLPDPAHADQGEAVQAVLFPIQSTNDTGAAVAAAAPALE
jgi:hypothetical protein